MRNSPDAPVWIGLGKSNHLKQLSHSAASAILRNLASRAGIEGKRIHYYLFRYTRIDEMQGILTESQQCMMFGWRFGSRMPGTYFRRYGKHIDDAQAIMNGIVPRQKQIAPALAPRTCVKCRFHNSPASKFCNKCGNVLDSTTVLKIEANRKEVEKLLDRLAENPEKLEKLLKLIG